MVTTMIGKKKVAIIKTLDYIVQLEVADFLGDEWEGIAHQIAYMCREELWDDS